VGQTILVRVLDGAYNNITVTFPVDVTIIAWDGRALGVAPFNAYNHAYMVPANTPIHTSVARRFDALIKSNVPVSGFATVQFTDTRCGTAAGFERPVLFTGRIPINIGSALSGRVTNSQTGFGMAGVTVTVSGASGKTAVTDELGNYAIAGLPNGNYILTPSLAGVTFAPASTNVTLPGAAAVNFALTQNAGASSLIGVVFESRGRRGGGLVPGVTITLTGAASQTVVTDSNGRFAFNGLANGNYTVTPSSADFSFRPAQRNITINGRNASLQFRASLIP